jgi:hypothetical protein
MTLEIVLGVTALLLFVVIFEALRRRRLSENFALFWIGVGVAAVVLAFARPLIDSLSDAIGVSYGPTLVFAAFAVFLVIVCLSLSMHISRLEKRVEILAQQLALRDALQPTEDMSVRPNDDGDVHP